MLELEHEIADAEVIGADILSTTATESRAQTSGTVLAESLSVVPSTERSAVATPASAIPPSPDPAER